jgi:predicted phage terminase large subunit-like protein
MKIDPQLLNKCLDECENSLVEYRKRVLENESNLEVPSAKFHHTWSNSLLRGNENEAIEAFRGSGKTQLVLRAFPMHCMTFPNKNLNYIVFIKSNATQAGKVLKAISREHKQSPLACFNLEKVIEDSGQVYHTLNMARTGELIETRIEAYGKGQAIRGISWGAKRPDVIIIDDPQDREEARSELQLANDWEWFLSDIKFLGSEGGSRIFLIGNNLGEKCIIEKVMSDPELLNFRCSRIPRVNGTELAWQERGDTLEAIDKLKASYSKLGQLNIFYEEVLCQSIAEENKLFKEEDYRYFNLEKFREADVNYCAVLDPASSIKQESCYRSITVAGVDEMNNWFIVDNPFGRWDSSALIDEIFKVVRKFRLKEFGIEKGIFEQVLKPFITQKMQRDNVYFNIIPLEHAKRGTKLERIKMLQPRFKAHTIWFPDHNPAWLVELKTELNGVTKDAIRSEYIDLVDSLAMVEQLAVAPYFGRDEEVFQKELSDEVAPMSSAWSKL